MEDYSDGDLENEEPMLEEDAHHEDEVMSEGGSIHSEAEEVPAMGKSPDKAGSEQKRTVKPKKTVNNPQPKLNFDALKGPKGLIALNNLFKNVKFKGNGHEKEDLAQIMKLTEQWAYRLYPKFHFEDSLQRLESLGKKKMVQYYLTKIRMGIIDNEEVVRQFDDEENVEDEVVTARVDDVCEDMVEDQFDKLLSQQIQATQPAVELTEEQKERLERNRRMALERRLAKSTQQDLINSDELTDVV